MHKIYKYLPKSMLIVFFCSMFTHTAVAQDYLWPTDASRYMSSSFCEFRVGHYHSAIDIKTWLREGYKCFAIADGEIVRIRVSPFGYGKVLYLRLDDGNTAVYAHLQRFSPKIEALVRKKQLARKKYTLNWSDPGIRVRKGDVIAYTGRTGIGVPHLHFEIRNRRDNPVNPLAFYDEVKDHIRPTLQQLAIIPLEPGATVNNNYLPQIFELRRLRSGQYQIKDQIRIRGRVGLAIRGLDRADEVGNKYGFYRTRLFVAKRPVYEITYDELDFATTEHIFTEVYYPIWNRTRDRFQKLYVEPFNPLPFYTRFPGTDGSITARDSTIDFKIEVYDFHGNLSVINGSLDVDPPALLVRNYERSGQWAYVDLESEPFSGFSVLTGADPDHMAPVDYFEVAGGKMYKPQEGLHLKIALADSLDRFVALKVKNSDDRESYTLLSPASSDSLHPEIQFMGDRLVVEVNRTAFPLTLDTGTGRVPFRQTDNGDYQAQLVVPDSQYAPLELAVTADGHSLWQDTLVLARLEPDRSQRFSWFDSSFSIVSRPGTVVEPLAMTVNRYQPDVITDSLPFTGYIYELYPQSLLLFKRMDAYIQMDSLAGEGSWSLFRVSDSGYLSYSAALEKLSADQVRTRIGSPGKYIIACDTIPPELAIAAPKNGSVYNGWPAIRFNLRDIHSGIGGEDNIGILLDGEYIMPEWDPEDKLVEAKIHLPLTRGTHTLTISVSDRSNNTAREALIFTIR